MTKLDSIDETAPAINGVVYCYLHLGGGYTLHSATVGQRKTHCGINLPQISQKMTRPAVPLIKFLCKRCRSHLASIQADVK